MAGTIKGITIEIGGNTKKLQTALTSANKTIKNTQYQLKSVNQSLKLDPSNTTLLKSKFDLLGDAVKEAKDKVDLLKNAEEQAAQQLKNGDIGQEQFDALKTKVAQAETELKNAEKELKSFGSVGVQQISGLGTKIQGVGDKVTELGKKFTVLSAGVAAIGVASYKSFEEVDDAMDIVTTKTGASGDALQDMQDRAKEIAETIPTSFETAASAIGEVNTRFGLTGDSLENLSTKFVEFAELNETDVSTSIDQVQKALDAYGLTAEDAGDVLDAMNATGQATGISMDTLADSLVTNAQYLQELGLSAEDSIALLGQFEKSGLDTSTMLQGLKTATKNCANDGVELSDALAALKDSSNVTADAIELFGSKAGTAIGKALEDGTLSLDDFSASLSDYSGNVEETFNATLDPIDQMQTTMNTLKDTGAELFNSIMEVGAPALETLSNGAKKLADWFKGLSPETQETIVKIGLLAAAIAPVLTIGGKLISGVGSIMTLAPKLASAFSFLISPVGLVIAAIAAAVAAGVLIYKNWDTIKEKAAELWEKLKEVFSTIIDFVKNNWQSLALLIVNPFAGAFSLVYNNCDSFKKKIDSFIEKIKSAFSSAWSAIKTTAAKAWDGIKSAIVKPLETAKTTISGIVDTIKNMFSNAKFTIPHISLPHFSISPSGWKITDLLKGVKPTLGIKWYDKGGIFNSPSVIGVGEKRPEFVGALDDLRTIVREESSPSWNITINAAEGQDAEAIANAVMNKIKKQYSRKVAAY